MAAELKLLQAGPVLQLRQETVDAAELGGAVIARGLKGSELFAVQTYRQQALGRLRQAQAQHARLIAALPEGTPADNFEAPSMTFEELRFYGLYISHMLAASITVANGMALYTVDEWELCAAEHPGLVDRLQVVVERLSGMNSEDVRKN